mmetsp:Transcript_17854/g.51380  ORF Transcript_17854/g.51380 Transcript_17854/m.51380 type:complete len:215 (+) Transcript_17854:865-1509(+)
MGADLVSRAPARWRAELAAHWKHAGASAAAAAASAAVFAAACVASFAAAFAAACAATSADVPAAAEAVGVVVVARAAPIVSDALSVIASLRQRRGLVEHLQGDAGGTVVVPGPGAHSDGRGRHASPAICRRQPRRRDRRSLPAGRAGAAGCPQRDGFAVGKRGSSHHDAPARGLQRLLQQTEHGRGGVQYHGGHAAGASGSRRLGRGRGRAGLW